MRVDLFDFDLPQDLIAQRPVSPRDSARLLEVTGDALHDRTVRDLPNLLEAGDLLVFNDTKVIPARLLGTRASGGKVEALLIRQQAADRWLAFAKPGKRLKVGDTLAFGTLHADDATRRNQCRDAVGCGRGVAQIAARGRAALHLFRADQVDGFQHSGPDLAEPGMFRQRHARDRRADPEPAVGGLLD